MIMENNSFFKWCNFFGVLSVCAMFWACSSSSGDDDVAGGASGDMGVVAMKIAGTAQKGPFVEGSAVTVRGIDCETMELTGEVFESAAKSGKGDFVVDSVMLSTSTCAIFEVTGKYLNELTGKLSESEITLHALSDLKNRKKVNINLLTELEYERVMYLVTHTEMSFDEAKFNASQEVLWAFNIPGSSEAFENMSIFDLADRGSIVLAVSVLMQVSNDSNEKVDVAARIDRFEDSFVETGVWSDSVTKASITDWAISAVSNGELDSIRKNIEGWGFEFTVPSFETFVNIYESNARAKRMMDSVRIDAEYVAPCRNDSVDNCEYGMLTDARDGHVYKTVKIGKQWWMAENLNFAYLQGTSSRDSSSVCHSTYGCEKYGRLYMWSAVMDSAGLYSEEGSGCGNGTTCRFTDPVRGVCPEGWHVPTRVELLKLTSSVREPGESDSSSKWLKATSGWWIYTGENVNGTDKYGFSALPSGMATTNASDGKITFVDLDAYYWTSTDVDDTYAYGMTVSSTVEYTQHASGGKGLYFAVRCAKDDGTEVVPWSSSSANDVKSSSSADSSLNSVGAFIWSGRDGEYFVDAGVDNGSGTSGYWYAITDTEFDGASTLTWPVPVADGASQDSLSPIIDECNGICATYALDVGDLGATPYVGVAFDVAGKGADGTPEPADFTLAGGLCVTYVSDEKLKIELSLGAEKDKEISHDYPYVSLPKHAEEYETCSQWKNFAQGGWGTAKVTGEEAATMVATIRFVIQAKSGSTGSFKITKIRSM